MQNAVGGIMGNTSHVFQNRQRNRVRQHRYSSRRAAFFFKVQLRFLE
jgi:hypothetical protein